MKIQVTMFHKEGKYRPIATTINVKDIADFENNKTNYIQKAITKIAQKRYRTPKELVDAGYTSYKYRPYQDRDRKQAFVEKILSEMKNN